jgi:hypothetical protein
MIDSFVHDALELTEKKMLVYTAMSKHLFYYRMFISKFVLEHGAVPLNPFMLFDYFLLDSVDRDRVREGNNNLVMRADEVWVFGPVSNGVLAEVTLAKKSGKRVRYYAIEKPHAIVSIDKDSVEMEPDVAEYKNTL